MRLRRPVGTRGGAAAGRCVSEARIRGRTAFADATSCRTISAYKVRYAYLVSLTSLTSSRGSPSRRSHDAGDRSSPGPARSPPLCTARRGGGAEHPRRHLRRAARQCPVLHPRPGLRTRPGLGAHQPRTRPRRSPARRRGRGLALSPRDGSRSRRPRLRGPAHGRGDRPLQRRRAGGRDSHPPARPHLRPRPCSRCGVPLRGERVPADRRRGARRAVPPDLPGPHRRRLPVPGARPGAARRHGRLGARRRAHDRRRPRARRHHRTSLQGPQIVGEIARPALQARRRVPRRHPGADHPHPRPGRPPPRRRPAPRGRGQPPRSHGAAGRQPARHPRHRLPVLPVLRHCRRRHGPGTPGLGRHRSGRRPRHRPGELCAPRAPGPRGRLLLRGHGGHGQPAGHAPSAGRRASRRRRSRRRAAGGARERRRRRARADPARGDGLLGGRRAGRSGCTRVGRAGSWRYARGGRAGPWRSWAGRRSQDRPDRRRPHCGGRRARRRRRALRGGQVHARRAGRRRPAPRRRHRARGRHRLDRGHAGRRPRRQRRRRPDDLAVHRHHRRQPPPGRPRCRRCPPVARPGGRQSRRRGPPHARGAEHPPGGAGAGAVRRPGAARLPGPCLPRRPPPAHPR